MVVVGEGLEKPKSILELDVKPDLDNSTPDCAISTNPTPLPETDGMEAPSFTPDSSIVELDGTEDGKQGAFTPTTVTPAAPWRASHERQANLNEPSAVDLAISDGDVEMIRLAYPRKVGMELARRTIKRQFGLLVAGGRLKADGSKLPKMTGDEAITYLKSGCEHRGGMIWKDLLCGTYLNRRDRSDDRL